MGKLILPNKGLVTPGQMTRRSVMRGMGAGAVALAAPSILRAQDEDKVLNLLTWPGHNDPAVIGPFTEATGIQVVAKEYVGGDNMVALDVVLGKLSMVALA